MASLAAILSDRALQPVAQAQTRLDAAKAEVAAIAQVRASLGCDASDPVQAALMARQGERLRHRQAAAMSEVANRQAKLDINKTAARPAFGRKIALEKLMVAAPRRR